MSPEILSSAITGATKGYDEFREAAVKRAVERFLDLQTSHTREEMVKELGLSRIQFRHLTQPEQFITVYNEYFSELKANPVLKAVQHELVDDLLPEAYRVIEDLLADDNAPVSVRAKLALDVLNRSGIQNSAPKDNDRRELAEFLKQRGIEVKVDEVNVNNTVSIPKEFLDAVQQTLPEVVDTEATEVDEESPQESE